jgi:hypothetical protein
VEQSWECVHEPDRTDPCPVQSTRYTWNPTAGCLSFKPLQEALAKLAAAKSALEAEQQLAAKRGSQVNELASQVESLKATLGSVSQKATDSQALTSLTAQLSERDDKIAVSWVSGCQYGYVGGFVSV